MHRKLKQDFGTRWNSTFDMLQSYMYQHEQMITALCLNKMQELCIEDEELEQPDIDLQSGSPAIDSTVGGDNLCASAKKIRTKNRNGQAGFILMDSHVLFEFLSSNMRRGECGHYSVDTGSKSN